MKLFLLIEKNIPCHKTNQPTEMTIIPGNEAEVLIVGQNPIEMQYSHKNDHSDSNW